MTVESDFLAMVKTKEKIATLNAEFAELEAKVVAGLRAAKKSSLALDGGLLKGTLVEGTRVVIDEEALKDALTPQQWNKVTKTVLDKEKLEAMIVIGKIDKAVVASVSEERVSKPYLRITGTSEGISDQLVVGVKAPRKRTVMAKPVKP